MCELYAPLKVLGPKIIDANLESENFKSESLVMSALSLVISYEIVSINSSVL